MFSLHRNENVITDSSISGKNTYFLFKPFFPQVNNKRFSIYESTIPLTDRSNSEMEKAAFCLRSPPVRDPRIIIFYLQFTLLRKDFYNNSDIPQVSGNSRFRAAPLLSISCLTAPSAWSLLRRTLQNTVWKNPRICAQYNLLTPECRRAVSSRALYLSQTCQSSTLVS